MKYKLIVSGGTFDHFHKGHEAFIRTVLSHGEHVLLGITSDAYVQKFKNKVYMIQLYQQRKKAVVSFLKKQNALSRVTIAPIDSVLYPSKWESLPIEAVVVTEDTRIGAQAINADRKTKDLPLLEIVSIPIKLDDQGIRISSTNIREGKINTQGLSYVPSSWFGKELILPEIQRQWFKNPFGQLTTDISLLQSVDPHKIVTVGDVVTVDCNKHNIGQKLSVVDFIIQRERTYKKIQDLGFSGKEMIIPAENPSGHINPSLFSAITKAISLFSKHHQVVITVSGEEDLAVIPLVLALPLGFTVVYGQPNEGYVLLTVTTEAKDKAYALLQKFN